MLLYPSKCRSCLVRLEYLPFTVANLNLSALWLSENQAQPMVKFQTEFDERTGQKVLTCFLLPQQAFHTESMENLLRGSIATDQDSRSSWPERSRGSVVHFPDSECSDDEDSPSEGHLRRHGTPHPRELKNRHAKLLKKEIDGHVIPHEKDKKDQSFMPQRDPRWLEASDDSGYLEKKSLPQPTYTIPPKENNISKQVGEQSYVSVPYMSTKPEEPEELIKLEPEEVEDTIPKECQPLLLSETLVYPEAIRKPPQMLTPGDSDDIDSSSVERPATNLESDGGFAENEQENGDIGNSENDYADDEQVDPHRRRVIFPPEIEEQPEKENKLRRRDTPHHLKNKRINVMSSKDEADQVREILAQAAATAKMEKMEEKSILKESMSEANESSLLKDVAEEEVSLHVSRAVGQGLGISIAGGKGSTPYKGNDEAANLLHRRQPHSRSTLITFFHLYKVNPIAKSTQLDPAIHKCDTIRLVYTVHLLNSRCYHLQLLLHVIKGATFFDDLYTVDDHLCSTFKDACSKQGLLDTDDQAFLYHSLHKLQHLFAIMLAFCNLTDTPSLWNKYKNSMCNDILLQTCQMIGNVDTPTTPAIYNRRLLLEDLVMAIESQQLDAYSLNTPDRNEDACPNGLILRETSYNIHKLRQYIADNEPLLNANQADVYSFLLISIYTPTGKTILDAPSGTGKTFLLNLLVHLWHNGDLAIASSGIALTLLDGR
uniref:ATP-dependent DNA helicase n=1 Tax=Octopus bimaculoides TaxID=37653 RepID=A0A0L8GZ85_OCTBM